MTGLWIQRPGARCALLLLAAHCQAVQAQGEAPLITAQPQSQSAAAGSTVLFNITATGSEPLFYQWRKDGTNLANGGNCGGVTSVTLTLSNIQSAEWGVYSVVVSNACGSAASSNATLQLWPLVGWGASSSGQTVVPRGLSNVVALAAGGFESVALRPDGTVAHWGLNASFYGGFVAALRGVAAVAVGRESLTFLKSNSTVVGQPYVPLGLTNVVAIAAGQHHCLALKADGQVVAWGAHYDSDGGGAPIAATVPAGLGRAVAIAGGARHSLALRADGKVFAWGQNDHGQTDVPKSLVDVVAIAAGRDHSLALKRDGTVVAWGFNLSIGRGDDYLRTHQAIVPPDLTNVVAIAAGDDHSLALKSDGAIMAWGSNWQLFDDDRYYTEQAVVPSGLTNAVSVAAGAVHSLALLADGALRVVRQPAGRTAPSGTTSSLSVGAVSALALRYQWQRSGAALPGATNSFLTLRNLQLGDTAGYSVVVTDGQRSITSTEAWLKVIESPPALVVPPSSQKGYLGGPAVFNAWVDGSGPLACQWSFEGSDIPGATNATLVLSNLAIGDTGRYSLRVSNAFGTVMSSSVGLSVSHAVVWDGDGAVFSPLDLPDVVAVVGDLALKRDGTLISWNTSGSTSPVAGLTNLAAISADLGLQKDGTVVAWGYGSVPVGLTNVTAIASGSGRYCAVKSDGVVVTWSSGWDGTRLVAVTAPNDLTNVVAVACGGSHILGLTCQGAVISSGNDSALQGKVPQDLDNVVAIAAGRVHSLALKADGTVVAWGSDYGTDSDDRDFYGGMTIAPVGLTDVVAIEAGDWHSLALKRNGTVIAWGYRYDGAPNVPPGLTHIATMAAWQDSSLAMIGEGPPLVMTQPANRTAYSGGVGAFFANAVGAQPLSYQWRRNGENIPGATNAILNLQDLRLSDAGHYSVAVANVLGSVLSREASLTVTVGPPIIRTSPTNQVAFLGGTVSLRVTVGGTAPFDYRWFQRGADGAGIPMEKATNATLVLSNLTASAAGTYYAVVSNHYGVVSAPPAAIAVANVAAWGLNYSGQASVPATLTNAVAIAAGEGYSLALRNDGTVAAWGGGDGMTAWEGYGGTLVPGGLSNVVAIAAGTIHSLALQADGTVVGWGQQLGSDGAFLPATIPHDLTNVAAIAAYGLDSLALRSDGTVVAWGYDYYGRKRAPTDLTDVVAIAAGGIHNLALRSDGTVVGWGQQEGPASLVPLALPAGLTNMVGIAAGEAHSLALRSDGRVVAWGARNRWGETDVPADLTNAVAIAAGEDYSLALRSDGAVVAWGYNYDGETDVPPSLTSVVAISAGSYHALALIGAGAPALTVEPFRQTVLAGTTASLTAMALGLGQLSYQWQCGGVALAGATNAVLSLTNVQSSQMGDYAVVVGNALGAVTSKLARLTVLVPPTLEPLPASAGAVVGSNITFTVEAIGTAPLRYQWRRNGVNIPGATNPWLTTTNVQVVDGGSYSVVVANVAGTVASDPLLLIVEVPAVPPGDEFANRVAVTGLTNAISGTNRWATREAGEPWHAGKFGSNSVWYTWMAPASGVASFLTVGSTFDTLLGVYTGSEVNALVGVAEDEDRGGYLTSQLKFNALQGVEYQIAIDGFAGEQGTFILTWELEPTAQSVPVIAGVPRSQTVREGTNVTFSVTASGQGLVYQWKRSVIGDQWSVISGATNASLALPNVQAADVGFYTVAITNRAGRGVESVPVALEIGPEPALRSQDKLEDSFDLTGSGGDLDPLGHLPKGPPTAPLIQVAAGDVDHHILNNAQGTTSARENHCGVICNATRWLVLKPNYTGTLVVDTRGSAVDTVLAAYTPTNVFLQMEKVACAVSGPGLHQSRDQFEVHAGQTYWVVVDGLDLARGQITLNWALGRAPEVANIWTNVAVAKGGSVTLSVGVSNALPAARMQWYRNELLISGATNQTLVVTNLQKSEEGAYSVVVSNAIEVVVQPVAFVEMQPVLVPVSQSAFENDEEQWAWGTSASNWGQAGSGWDESGFLRIRAKFAGEAWWWIAPFKYQGGRIDAYGGALQFDFKRWGGTVTTNRPVVVLSGAGLSVRFPCPAAEGANWTVARVPLREGAGWQRVDGMPAFREELMLVLANLVDLQIQGQFSAATETYALDNVVFMAPCSEQPPELRARLEGDASSLVLEWPASAACYHLEATASLSPAQWAAVTNAAPELLNGWNRLRIDPAIPLRFFRLRKT